jgi:hypothetical protein
VINRIVACAMVIFLLNVGQAFGWATEDGFGWVSYDTLMGLKNSVHLWAAHDNPMGVTAEVKMSLIYRYKAA